jgi:hypothetical protein
MSARSEQASSAREPKVPHTSIAAIGSSQVDEGWEDRKVRIWSSFRNDEVLPSDQECSELPLGDEVRGPFFTAPDDTRIDGGCCGNREERFAQLWVGLEDTSVDRTEFLKKKAKSLLDEGGVPLGEAKVEELSTDPLSHMLWAVKLNLKAYKETPAGAGDYWQRQFKKPKPELIDHSATGNESFFTASSPSSEEVVFRGRSSQLGSSSQSQGRGSSPAIKTQTFRPTVRSFGFEEQMKRRAREGSSLAGW